MSDEMIYTPEIAKRIGRSQAFVESALREGTFPVGKAIQNKENGRWSYIIPRAAFEAWINGQLPSTQMNDLMDRLSEIFDKFIPVY